ncbi:MAG: 3-dehydroquinate synthase [Bacteroidetes bacterium]|nr:3-dehydroquinate synthase [Bacteroidota bacterium]
MTRITYIQHISEFEKFINKFNNSVILCDQNSYKHCISLIKLNKTQRIITIKSGEKNKNFKTLEFIIKQLSNFEANRNTVLINVGGGVICDIGGLAAGLYKRGIAFVNIPTTLIAMADASHGGKTGINLNNLKNYAGIFSLPSETLIFATFLKTLQQKHIKSGFAEMLKHGIIADKNYFLQLLNTKIKNDTILIDENFGDFIIKSIEIKNCITANDFTEQNLRKTLNFGHTIGHALETYFIKKNKTHGECVATGIICESYISLKRGLLNNNDFKTIENAITTFFKPLKIESEQIEEISKLTLKDKKNKSKEINCILIKNIGEALFDVEVTEDEIKESIEYYKKSGDS